MQIMTSAHAQTEPRRASGLMEILTTPWVDKTMAIVATLPFVWSLYRRWSAANLSFPRAVLGIQVLILIITMVIRRTPVRVTPNPWFWLLAFVYTYGSLAFNTLAPSGVPLVLPAVSNALALVSAVIFIYARLSLGRSIGFVPANRGIVTTGAYRFVRHPVYTGAFFGLLAFVLVSYSPLNMLMAAILVALFMIKSVVEEGFLRADPEYAAYLQRVRWRWIPGIA